ncbi:hypothetical protein T492DRAFT_857917 [Pavlovales sp. CCMP2436]|nr:hypothetical protein T492DRAFT_857917 [Pavlovales sp. CCMP2436]
MDGQVECKATLEELARVSTSRAEDQRLLAEIQDSLEKRMVAPTLARRLGVECGLREEWRALRARDAMLSIARLTTELGEVAARALLDSCAARMGLDAVLMAETMARRAQPWQLALVAQTAAVAAAAREAAREGGGGPLGILRAKLLGEPTAALVGTLALLGATARALSEEAGTRDTPPGTLPEVSSSGILPLQLSTATVLATVAPPDSIGLAPPPGASVAELQAFVRERMSLALESREAAAAVVMQRVARLRFARAAVTQMQLGSGRARRGARARGNEHVRCA